MSIFSLSSLLRAWSGASGCREEREGSEICGGGGGRTDGRTAESSPMRTPFGLLLLSRLRQRHPRCSPHLSLSLLAGGGGVGGRSSDDDDASRLPSPPGSFPSRDRSSARSSLPLFDHGLGYRRSGRLGLTGSLAQCGGRHHYHHLHQCWTYRSMSAQQV